MKKDSTIPYCGDLAAQGRIVVGAKQVRKAVCSGRAACAYLAKNADPVFLEPLERLCTENRIPIVWVPTMAELGKLCRIEVGTATAALLHQSGSTGETLRRIE